MTAIDNSTEVSAARAFPSRRFGVRERKLLECAQEIDVAASANWDSTPTTISGAIDELASKVRAMECIVATYDKVSMSGTAGAVALSVTIPDNFVVTSIIAHVITAITDGAGGSPTIQLTAATDNITSLSPSISESDSAGVCRIGGACPALVTSGPGTTTEIAPIVTTGARALSATIASANLTAGKIRWFIFGFQSI